MSRITSGSTYNEVLEILIMSVSLIVIGATRGRMKFRALLTVSRKYHGQVRNGSRTESRFFAMVSGMNESRSTSGSTTGRFILYSKPNERYKAAWRIRANWKTYSRRISVCSLVRRNFFSLHVLIVPINLFFN